MGSSGSKSALATPAMCTENCTLLASEITKRVVDGRLTRLNATKMGGKTQMRPSDITDELKPLKAVATDMVVAEFFATAGTLYRFLQLVHSFFIQALKTYRQERNIKPSQLFFIFKGGNILRIIAHQFLAELPSYAKLEIEEFYAQFFKRSDNDFGIYLDPKVPKYEDIYDELSTLSYYLQVEIRTIILSDTTTYFDYSRYNDHFKRKVLNGWLSKFGAIEGKNYVDIYLSNGGHDSTTMFTKMDFGQPERQVAKVNLGDYGTVMKVTHNNALEFAGNEGVVRKFNLTRTKLHFTLKEQDGSTQAVEGELIDVSIGHKDDTGIKHFFEHPEGQIVTYTLTHPDTDIKLSFDSYSIKYLTEDLEGILFLSFEVPWEDAKYVKRLNRLMYIYFIDVFINRPNTQERLKVLNDFDRDIIDPILEGGTLKSKEFRKSYKDLNISVFVDYITQLGEKTTSGNRDAEEYIKMAETLRKNVTFLIATLGKVRDYCRTDGVATEPEMYVGNLKQFV